MVNMKIFIKTDNRYNTNSTEYETLDETVRLEIDSINIL